MTEQVLIEGIELMDSARKSQRRRADHIIIYAAPPRAIYSSQTFSVRYSGGHSHPPSVLRTLETVQRFGEQRVPKSRCFFSGQSELLMEEIKNNTLGDLAKI